MNAPALRRALVLPVAAALTLCGCSADWPAFRHDALRTATQPEVSPLSNPEKVAKLKCLWRFPQVGQKDLTEGFRASPIVYKGQVLIGNGDGYFYALDADTGQQNWRYPSDGSLPLTSKFTCNPSSLGIASSAAIAKIHGTDAVIFAAPDRSIRPYLGHGRLFALETRTGRIIWKSPVIARLTGMTKGCTTELHENLGYSSPLVLGDKVYVGVSDHCDNPVQKGRVAAIDLASGRLIGKFKYCSTHLSKNPADPCEEEDKTRGGGVSSPLAGWEGGLYVTTGNTRSGQSFQPGTNRGLSLLRLNPATGAVAWEFQPVPWEIDSDPDWSAAPTIMSTSCGLVIISTQKDGWTHALNAADGSRRWSFPPQKDLPFQDCRHGDSKYMRSGAAWGDVYVTMNGSLNLPLSTRSGYRRLHAFNVCAPEEKRLRWLVDVPGTSGCKDSADPELCLGNPTVSGGIFYVGTDQGVLVAIADPTVAPRVRRRCAHPNVSRTDCAKFALPLVSEPRVLVKVQLSGSMVYTEPVLANGKVYVSTAVAAEGDRPPHGYVYMLRPSDKENRCEPPS